MSDFGSNPGQKRSRRLAELREAHDEAEAAQLQAKKRAPGRSPEHVISQILRSSHSEHPRSAGVMRKAMPGDADTHFDGISRPGPLADAGAPGKVLAAGNFAGGKYDEST